jgi:hypothetical protein
MATPYGFTSPLPGTVEAICAGAPSWLRNEAGARGGAAGFALGVLEEDEHAVAARPSMAIRTTAKRLDFIITLSVNETKSGSSLLTAGNTNERAGEVVQALDISYRFFTRECRRLSERMTERE